MDDKVIDMPETAVTEEEIGPDDGYIIQIVDHPGTGAVGLVVRGMEKHKENPMLPATEAFYMASCVEAMIKSGAITNLVPVVCQMQAIALDKARHDLKEAGKAEIEKAARTKPRLVLPTEKEVEHIDKGKNKQG